MAEHSGLTRAILAILQPSLPDSQHKLPRSGPVAWAIRLFLVWYTVLTTLLVVLLLLLAPNALPQHPEWRKMSPVRRFARVFAIYTVSNFIWAITSYGSPPEVDRFKIPWLSQKVFSRDWRQSWRKGQLHTHLQLVPPLRKVHRSGIVSQVIPAALTPCFWLSRSTPDPNHDRHVFLYLVGGGYVIGTPLLGSFAYSLVHATSHPVFAPDYTKALSLETSFPGPLCEALAAYQSLRDQGWSSKQIVVIGDSAGGGLAWSLLVYLAALKGELGVPKQVIMVSPWLCLPPASDSAAQLYPDILNTPQLQGAARNYLARFPPYPSHPDPFHAEPAFQDMTNKLRRLLLPRKWVTSVKTIQAIPSHSYSIESLLSLPSFAELSSAHPLYSPASLSPAALSPITTLIAETDINFFIHTGTAEIFHPATERFHHTLVQAGVNCNLKREEGGVHCEPLFWPASFGGAPGRCIDEICNWLDRSS